VTNKKLSRAVSSGARASWQFIMNGPASRTAILVEVGSELVAFAKIAAEALQCRDGRPPKAGGWPT
jgi:hypothetical protein